MTALPPGDGHEPTVREARAVYFAENGFDEAGYEDRWVDLEAGPFTIRFPNSKARVAAVKLHDLHHVATGYATSWTGEGEAAAWEIAGGCGRHVAAWVLNLQAVAIAVFLSPPRVWRAFRRGLGAHTLYHGDRVENWLDRPLAELRAHVNRADAIHPTATRAIGSFACWLAASMVVMGATVATTALPVLFLWRLARWATGA